MTKPIPTVYTLRLLLFIHSTVIRTPVICSVWRKYQIFTSIAERLLAELKERFAWPLQFLFVILEASVNHDALMPYVAYRKYMPVNHLRYLCRISDLLKYNNS